MNHPLSPNRIWIPAIIILIGSIIQATAETFPEIPLEVDDHWDMPRIISNLRSLQEPGRDPKSYKNYPEIVITRDDGLMGTGMTGRWMNRALPDGLINYCCYVGNSQPTDTSEGHLEGRLWVSLIRRGAGILLSDGHTNHYSIVWGIDLKNQQITFLDRWPDGFFLQAGLNTRGIESISSTDGDGAKLHTISFSELFRVAVGFIQVFHVNDARAFISLYPEHGAKPDFMLSWASTTLASLNGTTQLTGLMDLSLAERMSSAGDGDFLEVIERHRNAALLLLNAESWKTGNLETPYNNYKDVSLPLLLSVLDNLTANAKPDVVEESMRPFAETYPDRLEPGLFLARSLLKHGTFEETLQKVLACESNLIRIASKIIKVPDSERISVILNPEVNQHPVLLYYQSILRRLHMIVAQAFLQKGDLENARNWSLKVARDHQGFSEPFFLLAEISLKQGNFSDDFGYLLVAYKFARTFPERDSYKKRLEEYIDSGDAKRILPELGAADREFAEQVIAEINTLNNPSIE